MTEKDKSIDEIIRKYAELAIMDIKELWAEGIIDGGYYWATQCKESFDGGSDVERTMDKVSEGIKKSIREGRQVRIYIEERFRC